MRGWGNKAERDNAEKDFTKAESELRLKIKHIQEETQKEIKSISQKADKIFSNHYRPHASQIDLQAVELLKSGVLTDSELTYLAKDYKDNFAMSKVLLPYIQKAAEKNPEMRKTSGEILLRTKPFNAHTEAINAVCEWGNRQMQDDFKLSKTMQKHFDEKIPQIIEHYGEYTAECEE